MDTGFKGTGHGCIMALFAVFMERRSPVYVASYVLSLWHKAPQSDNGLLKQTVIYKILLFVRGES